MADPAATEQTTIPGTEAQAAKPAVPARDYEADIKAAEQRAAKAEKAAKAAEAKHAETAGVLEKLKGVFGGEAKDPAAEVAALRERAAQADARAAEHRRTAARMLVEREVVALASREGAIDPSDLVALVSAGIDVDEESMSIKDHEALVRRVSEAKASKPYLFRGREQAASPAPIAGKPAPAPAAAKPAEAPAQELTWDFINTAPVQAIRDAIAKRSGPKTSAGPIHPWTRS